MRAWFGLGFAVLLAGCPHGSVRIGYDPVGSWNQLDEKRWPGRGDYELDSQACGVATRGLLGPTVVVSGVFPEWKGGRTFGDVIFSAATVPVEFSHDVLGGAGARPVEDELVLGEGTVLDLVEFWTREKMRVGTVNDDGQICWTWYELSK